MTHATDFQEIIQEMNVKQLLILNAHLLYVITKVPEKKTVELAKRILSEREE